MYGMINFTNLAAAFGAQQFIDDDDDYPGQSAVAWSNYLTEMRIKSSIKDTVKTFFKKLEEQNKKSIGDNGAGQILICCYCYVEADIERNRCPECKGNEFITTQKSAFYHSFSEIMGL